MTIRSHCLARASLTMLLVLAASCTRHQPRWTPQSVQPPFALEDALLAADAAGPTGAQYLAGDGLTTMSLTRDGAILTGLSRNLSLAVERTNPLIADTFAPEARAAFDPRITGLASFGRDTQPAADSDNSTRTGTLEPGASQLFPTGTEVFLSGALNRTTETDADTEYEGSWSLGVNQALLRGAGTAVNLAAVRIAENDAEISAQQLRAFVIELTRQIEIAYWDLVLALDTLRIRESSVTLAESQVELTETFLEVGKGTEAAVLSSKAEVATRTADLVDAQAAVRARQLDLIRLLSPDAPEQFLLAFDPQDPATAEHVTIHPAQSAQLARMYRPDLAEARLALANRDLEVLLTRNGLLPRLDAFASYGRLSRGGSWNGAFSQLDESEHDNYEAGLRLEWEPLNRAARARAARAQFQQTRAEAAIANLEQLLATDVRQAALEVERQWQRYIAVQQTVAGRTEELRAAQAQFDVGFSTTLDLLQIQVQLIQSQVDVVTARVRYIQALTNLYAEEGTLLDRRGVTASP